MSIVAADGGSIGLVATSRKRNESTPAKPTETIADETTRKAAEVRQALAELGPEVFEALRTHGNAIGMLPLFQELSSSQPSIARLQRWGMALDATQAELERAALVFRDIKIALLNPPKVHPAVETAQTNAVKLSRVVRGIDSSLCPAALRILKRYFDFKEDDLSDLGVDDEEAAAQALRALDPCFASLTRADFVAAVEAATKPRRQQHDKAIAAAVLLANQFDMPRGSGPTGSKWTAQAFTSALSRLKTHKL